MYDCTGVAAAMPPSMRRACQATEGTGIAPMLVQPTRKSQIAPRLADPKPTQSKADAMLWSTDSCWPLPLLTAAPKGHPLELGAGPLVYIVSALANRV